MKLDDIAKMAIDEVSAELEKIEKMNIKDEQENISVKTAPKYQINAVEADNTEFKPDIEINNIINSEEIFLRSLKERTEVLFEGLNEISKDDLPHRLELTLKFLEFLLANVENRIESISK